MSKLLIRSAKSPDIDKLIELRLSLQRHLEAVNPQIWRITEEGAIHLKQELKESMKDQNCQMFVAVMDGQVIGFVHGQVLHRTNYLPNQVGIISNLYVQESFRRRGVGMRLVGELCRFFRQRNVKQVTLRYVIGNREAEYFWSRLGFESVIKTANVSLKGLEKRLNLKS